MHELSIAMSLVEVAGEKARQLGTQVVAVHLKLGPLSGVVAEALLGSYEIAAADSPLAGSRLVIHPMPIVAWCPICSQERHIPSPQRICCPVCDTPTPDIRGGRELEVSGLEIPDDPANAHGGSAAASAQAK